MYNDDCYIQRRIQDRRAGRAPPRFEKMKVFFGKSLTGYHAYTLILVNKQCLYYVFNSLLLLQTNRVCVKGHQNKPQA